MTANALAQGLACVQSGEYDHAVQWFCQAIQQQPNCAAAYNNLGLVLKETGRRLEAEACFRRAVALEPEQYQAYNNLGLVLLDLSFFAEAETCFRRALALQPAHAAICNNLGTALEELADFTTAEMMYRQAISLRPDYPEAHYNLGVLLRLQKRLEEAQQELQQAVVLRPGYVEAELSLALLHLLRANFREGWAPYERLRKKKYGHTDYPVPLWQQESLVDRTILLYWEYGFGDTIQFLRYVPLVEAQDALVSLWVQAPLVQLVRLAYPHLTIYGGTEFPPDNFDYCCSLLSLPVHFATDADNIPLPPVYQLDKYSGTAWPAIRPKLSKGLRVGIVWAGHPKHNNDQRRSIPFATFRQVLDLDGIDWVSLQVGEKEKDLHNGDHAVLAIADKLTDYAETASVIAQLDLVITVDTSVAHLAGSLRKPVWVLLAYDPDWRWQLERCDSPWYPVGMRLFRQSAPGDWVSVLQAVRQGLRELLST